MFLVARVAGTVRLPINTDPPAGTASGHIDWTGGALVPGSAAARALGADGAGCRPWAASGHLDAKDAAAADGAAGTGLLGCAGPRCLTATAFFGSAWGGRA